MIQSDYWYKNAVFYSIDVELFMDSNGDGIGDFQGLIEQLDYLDRLGVDCVWLLPFYPSPDRDNGYDVTDYFDVDSKYGDLGDFVELVREANSRGIRILIDLVTNHTSDQHPWFQAARRGEEPYRDYYVWSEDPPEPDADPIFPNEEDSVWSYDEEAEAYYYHRFYAEEPGLDLTNPDLRDEIKRIMGFWLELGVSGFRFDAAPIMIGKKGLESTALEDPHEIFREFRRFVERRSEDALLLGEAAGTPEEIRSFFGDGDEMDMVFNFLQTAHLFHSLATEDATSLSHGLEILPELPETCQWANFLRIHDELNLEWLTDAQRDDVFEAFAPEERMQVFDRGIRRRLAPMLGGDGKRVRMALSLLFSLPGSPLLYYGEEIGMGDDLSLEERDAVRTPMQWSAETNGGFSSAPADELAMPVVDEGAYGYESVNVDAQRDAEGSLLTWVERLTGTRQEHPEIGWGEFEIVGTDGSGVFAHQYAWKGRRLFFVHNLSGEARHVPIDLDLAEGTRIVNVLDEAEDGYDVEHGTVELDLDPYGCRWYRIGDVQAGRNSQKVR